MSMTTKLILDPLSITAIIKMADYNFFFRILSCTYYPSSSHCWAVFHEAALVRTFANMFNGNS